MQYKILPLLLVLVLNSFLEISLSAQSQILTGTIIERGGDTLHGFILYEKWRVSPEEVKFKESHDAEFITYSPLEIRKFIVNNQHYYGGVFDVENSPTRLDDLNSDKEYRIQQDTLFIKGLIFGKKELFMLEKRNLKRLFYIRISGEIVLLRHKQYIERIPKTEIGGAFSKDLLRNRNEYIGILRLYLDDQPGIDESLENVEYNQYSLVKLFQGYYQATNQRYELLKNNPLRTIRKFGLNVGIGFNRISILESEPYYLTIYPRHLDLHCSFSAFYDLEFPGPASKSAISFEGGFSNFGFYYFVRFDREDKDFTEYTVNFSYLYGDFRALYKIEIPADDKFGVFFKIGPSAGVVVLDGSGVREKNYTYPYLKYYRPYKGNRKYQYGMDVCLGVKIHRFKYEFRYEIMRGYGISYGPSMDSQSLKIHLGVNF